MTQPSLQLDPIDSPHPVPWNWVIATLSDPTSGKADSRYSYRSQSLLSPDGEYAAYSRIQMQPGAAFYDSSVSSVLFLENLRTGDLQAITPTSPLADNPFLREEGNTAGRISIAIPVAWSETGDRLLARVFEAIFCTDIASDYALLVDRTQDRVSTIAPTSIQYTTAVLLGWSEAYPGRALFRAGNLGDPNWQLWAVDHRSETTAATGDRPTVFGQPVSNVWMGPQVQMR
jgi:hypothetical protein